MSAEWLTFSPYQNRAFPSTGRHRTCPYPTLQGLANQGTQLSLSGDKTIPMAGTRSPQGPQSRRCCLCGWKDLLWGFPGGRMGACAMPPDTYPSGSPRCPGPRCPHHLQVKERLIQQQLIFVEHLLGVRHCSGHLAHGGEGHENTAVASSPHLGRAGL